MLRCPVDGYPLAAQAIGPTIAICEKCSGVWFTREALIAPSVEPDSLPRSTRTPGSQPRRKTRSCPVCRSGLFTERIEGIEIDRCSQCAGVWLDAGEYDIVRNRIEERKVSTQSGVEPANKKEWLIGADDVVQLLLELAQIFS
jgi:Zn-finger nucleic acid-binding protein